MITDAIISSLVDNLVSTAISFVPKLHILGGKEDQIIAQIKRWQKILEDLHCFLQDAEDKKQDNLVVRRWLEDVEELTYDAEDMLEEFNYEVIRHQMDLIELPSRSSKWSLPKRSKACWPNSEMIDRLDAVTQRMQSLKDRMENLNLLRSSVRRSVKQRWSRDPSVSLLTEPVIFGRDEEKEGIIRMLLTQEEGNDRIMVIAIVGMGGLGKTTLARYVYNDPRVESNFHVRGWVCVSADYDTRKISKEVLESICFDCGDATGKSLDWIQGKLGKALRNKKFLLVLDDNWNDKYGDWNALRAPFLQGSSGSRIIVTTRSHNVADTVRTVGSIIPRHLSKEDCWSLICTHAGLNHNTTSLLSLEEIGKSIAGKCSGLPLAAMSLGGLLRNKTRVEQWKAILDNLVQEGRLDVTSVLMMSYEDLNSQEKRCFSFLSLFQEDHKFLEDEVVLLWVGAGLIRLEEELKSKKELGHKVFHGLLSRSLLSPKINTPFFVMHDMIRDLAQQVSKKNRYIAKDDRIDQSFESTCHLSFHSCKLIETVNGIMKETKHTLSLRSFLVVDDSDSQRVMPIYLENVFVRLKCLRVLHLKGLNLTELPESIGQLPLLRYLDVSWSAIQSLPTSITSLYNLEILILRVCRCLEQLPERIENLINLSYLHITKTSRLQKLPEGMKQLRRLRNLSDFIIGEKLPLSSLESFNLLQGNLYISNLRNVASTEDAILAQLCEKRLEELILNWWRRPSSGPVMCDRWFPSASQPEMEQAENILEWLQPHEGLKALTILWYGGSTLPKWLASSLRYLAVLKLEHCGNCTNLEAMASLEELRIVNCPEMRVFFGRMPLLKDLEIKNCKEVGCTEIFSLDSLQCVILQTLDQKRMSPLFKYKVTLGSSQARSIVFRDFGFTNHREQYMTPYWTLPSISMIGDDFSGQMKVQKLQLYGEDTLDNLPKWISNAPSLQNLLVEDCPSLKILVPYGEFPSSLTHISVGRCETLESFHEEKLPSSIQRLEIWDCPLLVKQIKERDQQLCSKISHIPSIRVDGWAILLS